MLTLSIPRTIPAAARREALRKARTDARRYQIIMQHTAKRRDLGAFRHARHQFTMSCEAVRAWESLQIEDAAA